MVAAVIVSPGRQVRHARQVLVGAVGVSAARGLGRLVAGGDRLAGPELWPLVGSTAGARRSGRCVARGRRGTGAEMAIGRAAAMVAATATGGGRGGCRFTNGDGRGGQLAGRGAERST